MYIEIGSKQDNGCEIHNALFSECGVMLCLFLVINEQDSDIKAQDNNEVLALETAILKYLTLT